MTTIFILNIWIPLNILVYLFWVPLFSAAHKLPGDDGEFYQFCYVASNYQIRGASTPFQFRRPSADDFVEIEDEETNMLVIRSKTVLLQENLQYAEVQKNKLIEVFIISQGIFCLSLRAEFRPISQSKNRK